MRRDDLIGIFIVSMAVVASVAMVAGAFIGEAKIRRDAILHGVAEWRVDSRTGDTSYHWIEPKTQNESESK